MTKRMTTIMAILLAIVAALLIFKGPPASADVFSPKLARGYATVTETCFALKKSEAIPLSTVGCSIGAVSFGDATTQFDITQPYGSNTDIVRVTWDGTGTDPGFIAAGKNAIAEINCQNFSAGNNGYFNVTTAALNYFEFTNSSNVVEDDKTIGTGSFMGMIYRPALGGAAGISTAQFDITNPTGNTFRYTWDGAGTSPGINSSTIKIGGDVDIASPNFNVLNCGYFIVTGSGEGYFEITNAAGVAESNLTFGNGYIKYGRLESEW